MYLASQCARTLRIVVQLCSVLRVTSLVVISPHRSVVVDSRSLFALLQMNFVLPAYFCFDCSASCVLRAASELTHTYIFTTLLPSSQSINRVLCSLNCASFHIRYRVIIRIYLDIVEYQHISYSSLCSPNTSLLLYSLLK